MRKIISRTYLKPSHQWLPEMLTRCIYEKALHSFFEKVRQALSGTAYNGFFYSGKMYSVNFEEYPLVQIMAEPAFISCKSIAPERNDFIKSLQEHKDLLARRQKTLRLLKNLFLRLKHEDPRLYFHFIPDNYINRVSSLVPKLADESTAKEEDKGYGFFLLTPKEESKVAKIKQEFAPLYEYLAGEEFLLRVFKD